MKPLFALLLIALLTTLSLHAQDRPPTRPPNIVLILADDQGWGDLGCYGNPHLQTPNIDQLAAEGTRFTNAYSGSAVCAPTRCVLMTGLHTGHARRRDNEATGAKNTFTGRPLLPLSKDDLTIASVLKQAGYATAGFGKWGLGNPGTTGTPDQHGFDHFFGYLDQVHAHDYYTPQLWRDTQYVPVPGNAPAGPQRPDIPPKGKGTTYSHDLIAAASLDFIRNSKDKPFFAYLAFTLPHGDYVVPSDAPYSDAPWPQQVKTYAAMTTRLDATVGQVMALLKELHLDDNTLVLYTSDNGPNPPFRQHLNSAGPFRGIKRELYEGGLRCPMIARWPGKVPAGRISDFVWSQVDLFATFCDVAGIKDAPKTDGMSVLPTLLGKEQRPHDHLYWEIHTPRFHQAVRMGNWKALRFGTQEKVELYDLLADPAESKDVAAEHPEIVQQIESIMSQSHTPTPYWPLQERARPARRGQNAQPD